MAYEESHSGFGVDSMPHLLWKNTKQSIRRYNSSKFPAILSKVQKRNPDQCHTIEDVIEQRARHLSAEPASPFSDREAGSFYLICLLSLLRKTERTVEKTDIIR